MDAVSPTNLTVARKPKANDVRTALETGGALGGVTGIAPFSPDDRGMHVGVNGSLSPGVGRKGSQVGVAHAHVPDGATASAARLQVASA